MIEVYFPSWWSYLKLCEWVEDHWACLTFKQKGCVYIENGIMHLVLFV